MMAATAHAGGCVVASGCADISRAGAGCVLVDSPLWSGARCDGP